MADKKNVSAKAAREAAAAARAASEADQKKRDRTVRIIGGSVIAVVMAALIAIPLLGGKNDGPTTDGKAALPASVSSETYGVRVGDAWKAANADSIPTLSMWEDFQCPACGNTEKTVGSTIVDLAKAGKIRLEWRPTIFLDNNLSAENTAKGNPNSSLTATMAFGCAADAGKAVEFHTGVFAAQPATEGDGYSIDTLTQVASGAGISGADLDTFSKCLADKKYEGWVNNSFDKFSKEGVSSTPTAFLNGKELTPEVLNDAAALTKAIEDAAAAK